MKKYIIALLGSAALLSTASAVTLSGTAARFIGTSTGGLVPTNTLAFLLVDVGGNGFSCLTNNSLDAFASFTAGVASSSTNFGGDDRIIRAFGSGGSASTPVLSNILPSTNLAAPGDLLGKKFALVWFEGLTSAATSIAAGTKYGFVTSSNWTLPASDAGGLTFGTTPNTVGMNQDTDVANFDTPVANPDLAGAFYTWVDTNGAGAGGIRGAATLSISAVPEPSTAAIGLLVGLGALVRRRRD